MSETEAASYSKETTVAPGSEPVVSLSKTSDLPDSQEDQKAKEAKAQNPSLSFWPLSLSLILLILLTIPFKCNNFCSINYLNINKSNFSLYLGILLYFVVQKQLLYRIIAVLSILYIAIICSLNDEYDIIFLDFLVIGSAFIISLVVKGSFWRKFGLSSLVAMGVYFIWTIVSIMMVVINHEGMNSVRFDDVLFFENCLSIAMVGVFAYLVYYFCDSRKAFLKTGIGSKIWFCLVTIGALFGVFYGFYSNSLSLGLAAVTIFAVAGYMALLLSQSVGWPIVLLAIILSFYARILTLFVASSDKDVLVTLGFMVGLIILWFITWLCVKRGWRNCRIFDLQKSY
ncbi:MAG: hypothetical protein LBI10_00245 [Deltaproteobacteria bacterium]|nr:hypothetical protein [Deltaproteobacteria bacterium]